MIFACCGDKIELACCLVAHTVVNLGFAYAVHWCLDSIMLYTIYKSAVSKNNDQASNYIEY